MAPNMPPTSNSVDRSADSSGPKVPERNKCIYKWAEKSYFKNWLTGRLYIERQPVHERIADQLGEEQAKRELNHAGYIERINQANGTTVSRWAFPRRLPWQDGGAFGGRWAIANLILQVKIYVIYISRRTKLIGHIIQIYKELAEEAQQTQKRTTHGKDKCGMHALTVCWAA